MNRASVLLLLLVSIPLFAQQRNDNEVSVSYGRIELKSGGGTAVSGASYNRFWTNFVSTRFGAFGGKEDLFDDMGEKSSRVVHAAAEVHLLRRGIVSPHVGGGVAYADHRVERRFAADERNAKVAPLFNAGVDINVTPRFALGFDAHYIRYGMEGAAREPSNLTSTTLLGSARFRW